MVVSLVTFVCTSASDFSDAIALCQNVWFFRRLADKKLKQRNKMSNNPLHGRPARLPCTSSVLRISEPAEEPRQLATQ
jgi:hypothetical protein